MRKRRESIGGHNTTEQQANRGSQASYSRKTEKTWKLFSEMPYHLKVPCMEIPSTSRPLSVRLELKDGDWSIFVMDTQKFQVQSRGVPVPQLEVLSCSSPNSKRLKASRHTQSYCDACQAVGTQFPSPLWSQQHGQGTPKRHNISLPGVIKASRRFRMTST